ncbi:MAG: ABC transporter ATP-binding protein [Chitinophagaceae bacterium]|nr:ABC transporter ATP-binding protein [Chitinophagaceae bacterium]
METKALSKQYGNVRALNEVSLQVHEGTVYGILGPNGSGKTTMLGTVLDIIKPTSGSVELFGEVPAPRHRKTIGTLLETPNFYHYLNAEQNLKIAAALKGIANPDFEKVLKQVNLYERRKSPFSSYSLGMKQRLAIASCLLGEPRVMIFDEPTNGLDPAGIAEIRQLIVQIAAAGKTIIMASHMLDEVEKVCTHVAILKKGVLLAAGRVDEILADEDQVEIDSATHKETLKSISAKLPGHLKMSASDAGRILLHFDKGMADMGAINTYFFNQGVALTHLQLKKQSLEARFIEMTNTASA